MVKVSSFARVTVAAFERVFLVFVLLLDQAACVTHAWDSYASDSTDRITATTAVNVGTLVDPQARLEGDDMVMDVVTGPACRTKRDVETTVVERTKRKWDDISVIVPPLFFLWFLIPLPDIVERSTSTRTEWGDAAAHFCTSDREAAVGAEIRTVIQHANASMSVVWTSRIREDGKVRIPNLLATTRSIAAYCGRAEITVEPVLAADPPQELDTKRESIDSPFTGIRVKKYSFTVEAGYARNIDVNSLDVPDLNVLTSCLDSTCTANARKTAESSCPVSCQKKVAPPECVSEKGQCDGIASTPDQHAVCDQMFSECLAKTNVSTADISTCVEQCVRIGVVAQCR